MKKAYVKQKKKMILNTSTVDTDDSLTDDENILPNVENEHVTKIFALY